MGMTSGFALYLDVDATVPAVLGEVEDAEMIRAGEDTWCSVLVDEEVFWARDEILRRIVEETGRPALVGLTLDSDFLGVVGRSPDGSTWDGVVDRDAADDYREEGLAEGYDVVVPAFSAPDVAVRGAIAWAEAAGLSADSSALMTIFSDHDWEKPADDYWTDLLAGLGIGS